MSETESPEAVAERLLPCLGGEHGYCQHGGKWIIDTNFHLDECPARFRPAVAAEIAKLRADVWREHRPTGSEEHDPANGKIHGCCIRCLQPWPCEYSPESRNKLQAENAELLDTLAVIANLPAHAPKDTDNYHNLNKAREIAKAARAKASEQAGGLALQARLIVKGAQRQGELQAENERLKADPRLQIPLDGPGSHKVDLLALRIEQENNDRLRAELDAISEAIGDSRWMDPPDGGDVSLAEQVRRLRAALADAERKADGLNEAFEQAREELAEAEAARDDAVQRQRDKDAGIARNADDDYAFVCEAIATKILAKPEDADGR